MNEPVAEPECRFETVAVVGVGLIGGSIAAALHARRLCHRVIGVGRSAEKLRPALDSGLIDAVATDVTLAAAESDLLIFCTPVDRIVAGVCAASERCRPKTLITDAGSVKRDICEALDEGLPGGVTFVGSHPLAGSEKTGFEHADADLFEGRVCVVTPTDNSASESVARIGGFWQSLGMTVIETSPAEHDRLLAIASHVPHVVAPALAAILDEETAPFAASGFRDSTRIAAGDPALWAAIFEANRVAVEAGLERFTQSLEQFREAVSAGNWGRLQNLLETAKRNRDAL
ncbi:MAG: prephenate dehydrogenase [Planctomycetaceae bacterium]